MSEKPAASPLLILGKSWERALRSGAATKKQRKSASPYTIRNYLRTLRLLDARLANVGRSRALREITAEDITGWLDDLTAETSSGNALHHYRNLGAFWAWAVHERMVTAGKNPMLEVLMPAANDTPRPPLTQDQVAAMVRTCGGRDRGFDDIRDEAIIRVFADTGMRLGGLVGLTYHPDHPGLDNAGRNDVFLDHDPPLLRLRLKGGTTHFVDVSARTATALDRYLRARSQHPAQHLTALWLGKRGALGRTGVQRTVRVRGEAAGISERVHAHRFRRSMATWHLDAGGSRDALKARAGWSSDQMINVYVSHSRDRLAWQESRRLGIADRF
ncbi:tyrosine-type recombinase/integrase [Nocardiopsis sp. ARC36]